MIVQQSRVKTLAVLWSMFFLMCFGLGYPTLSRYDLRRVDGLVDTRAYYQMVIDRTGPTLGEYAPRVLVSYAAKPFYWLAKGRVGTWNPVWFAMLLTNGIFTATTALLIVTIGTKVIRDPFVPLLGATLYLLNFAVSNLMLSGLVDSAQALLMMAIVSTLLAGRWWLLPLWGIVGSLTKESWVPLSVAFTLGWWVALPHDEDSRLSQLAWIGAMAACGVVTLTILMSLVLGQTPWSYGLSVRASSSSAFSYFSHFVRCVADRNFWYVFVWLLPLGVWRLSQLPRTWVMASLFGAVASLAMGTYRDIQGNVGRAVFDVAGPALSLSAALILDSWLKQEERP